MARRSYPAPKSKKSTKKKAARSKPSKPQKVKSKKEKARIAAEAAAKAAAAAEAGNQVDASESAASQESSEPTSKVWPAKKTTKKPAGKSDDRGGKSAPVKKGSSRNEKQRLQRLLAAAGFGSRRQCEDMIEEGRVEVDGKTITKLGTTVDPKSNKVKVDGVPLRQQKLVYYAVNKPTGVLSTNSDPKGRQRVIDLVPNSERVFPVGRLDASSQGLMLLTNDGELAQQLSHPKYGVRKVYRVTVAGKIDGETMRSMRKGIYISDGFVKVEGAKIIKSRSKATELEITLREGKNREIRRILARLGHKVQVLRRIAIGPLRIGEVPVGAHRSLTRDEIQRLRLAVEYSRKEVDQEEESHPRRKGTKKRSTAKRSTTKGASRKGAKSRPTKGGRKLAEGRKSVTAKRTNRKTPVSKFSFKPTKDDGGSVIGGD